MVSLPFSLCVCVCVCVCARARVCVCVFVRVGGSVGGRVHAWERSDFRIVIE